MHAVAKFARFFGRSPEKLDLEDVRAFQVHLVAGGMSWPALNQTVCALRFLYGVTLGRPDLPERIAHAREPRTLPVVLSADEVVRNMNASAQRLTQKVFRHLITPERTRAIVELADVYQLAGACPASFAGDHAVTEVSVPPSG